MSKLDLELEKARKEKEDLAKELEKVENEAQAVETRREIQFIKSNYALTSWKNMPTLAPTSIPTFGLTVPSQNMSQSVPASSSTTGI